MDGFQELIAVVVIVVPALRRGDVVLLDDVPLGVVMIVPGAVRCHLVGGIGGVTSNGAVLLQFCNTSFGEITKPFSLGR